MSPRSRSEGEGGAIAPTSPESCKNIRVLTSPEPAVGVIITLHSVVTGVIPFKVIVPLVLLAFVLQQHLAPRVIRVQGFRLYPL